MQTSRAIRCASSAGSATVHGLASYAGWSLFLAIGLTFLRPPAALAWLAVAMLVFLLHPRLGPAHWRHRRAALLHLRPLGAAGARLTRGLPFLLLGILVLQLVYARFAGWPRQPLTYAYANEPLGRLVVLGVAVLAAPLIEEFAFRGQLQGRATRMLGPWGAGALSALFFAAAHFNAAWLPYFFVNGAIFAYLLVASGSIWACVIAHAALNAWASALDPAHAWVVARSASLSSPVLALCAAALLAGALLLFRAGQRAAPTGRKAPLHGCRAAPTRRR